MKKIISILIIATISTGLLAKSKDKINITDIKVERKKEVVYISFNVDVGEQAVKQHKSITPVISNQSNAVSLRPIVVETRRGEIISTRSGRDDSTPIKIYKNGDSFKYSDSTAYSLWMSESSLVFNYVDDDCCSERQEYSDTAMARIPLAKPMPTINFEPKVSAIQVDKNIMGNGKNVYFISFPSSKDYTNISSQKNQETLAKLRNEINNIIKSENYAIKSIELTGYASPEGVNTANKVLAEKRAKTVKTYLQKNIPALSNDLFSLKNGGENWSKLRTMVVGSRMEGRRDALSIIDEALASDDSTPYKEKLRQLRKGETYRYMLRNFYPQLRNVQCITISYSLNKDSNENTINQCVSLINDKKYSSALTILLSIENDHRSWNALGVCYLMMGNIDNATKYLQKAAEKGDKDAIENLDMLAKLAEQYNY